MEFGRNILVSNRPVGEITPIHKEAFEVLGVSVKQSFDMQFDCASLRFTRSESRSIHAKRPSNLKMTYR